MGTDGRYEVARQDPRWNGLDCGDAVWVPDRSGPFVRLRPENGKVVCARKRSRHLQPVHDHGWRRGSVRTEYADRSRRLEEGLGAVLPSAYGTQGHDRAGKVGNGARG